MSVERQMFVGLLDDLDVDDDEIETIAYAFAVYEKGLRDEIAFLVEALGNVTVALTIEQAHEMATSALTEVIREV